MGPRDVDAFSVSQELGRLFRGIGGAPLDLECQTTGFELHDLQLLRHLNNVRGRRALMGEKPDLPLASARSNVTRGSQAPWEHETAPPFDLPPPPPANKEPRPN